MAPTLPAFISATKAETLLLSPCLVCIVLTVSNALLLMCSLISNTTVCAFTSCIPVTTTPLLPALSIWLAAFCTASPIAFGKLTEIELLVIKLCNFANANFCCVGVNGTRLSAFAPDRDMLDSNCTWRDILP